MRKLASVLMLAMLFTFGISATQCTVSPTVALAADLGSVMDEINNGEQVLGDETKNKVAGITNDIQSIVLIIVVGILMIGGLVTVVQFANVGDNSTEKAKLKSRLIYIVLVIVFCESYFGLMRFGLQNFNLFE